MSQQKSWIVDVEGSIQCFDQSFRLISCKDESKYKRKTYREHRQVIRCCSGKKFKGHKKWELMTRLKILTCTFLGDCVQWNQIWLKSRMQAITCCKILSRKNFIMMERMCSLNPWQAWDDLTRTFTSALSSPCHPKVKARWQPSSILFKLWRKSWHYSMKECEFTLLIFALSSCISAHTVKSHRKWKFHFGWDMKSYISIWWSE